MKGAGLISKQKVIDALDKKILSYEQKIKGAEDRISEGGYNLDEESGIIVTLEEVVNDLREMKNTIMNKEEN